MQHRVREIQDILLFQPLSTYREQVTNIISFDHTRHFSLGRGQGKPTTHTSRRLGFLLSFLWVLVGTQGSSENDQDGVGG